MVGDTGANALGAALGMGVVLTCSEEWRVVVLVALVVVNVASEWVSFSSVIDAVRAAALARPLGQPPPLT